MRTSVLAAGLLAVLVSLPVQSPAAAPASATVPAVGSDVPDIAFEKYTLPNGLEVILSQDRRLPMVAVNLWYHVGPANEDAGRTGFAHLFEHMMFQSSKHVPSDAHFKLLEGAGASDINGTTDFDRTNYFETLPSNQLELALWLESDRMGYLLDVLDQAALSNQQDVVRNERRQSVENQPYGIVQERLFQLLFPKGHPYYANVIGSHEDIQAAKLEDVQKFFRTFYAPNNASLAIVGDFETAEVKRLVAKYFGSLKSGPPVPKLDVKTPPITAERRAVVPDRIELPRVYMGWITSPIFTPGDAEADLAARVLGGGKSSRLYKKLVYELQIAQDVSAYQYNLTLGSVFGIEATARQGHTAAELEQVISAELDKFRREGPSAQEIERARNAIETQIVGGLETLGGFGGVADRLNAYNHYLGDPGYLSRDIARYRSATPDSVRKFAETQLATGSRVVVHGVPGKPELGPEVPTPPAATAAAGKGAAAVNVAEPWREKPPAPAAARAFQPPVPQSFKLANGLTVILNERGNLPIVNAALVFRTGSDANPVDKPGLANFTVAMLDEGTATRSSLQLADDVAQLGAMLATSSSMDNSNAVVSVLKRNFPAAMKLLGDVVLNPTFPAAEVERQRGQRLSQLIEERQQPGAVASKTMAAALYGPQHPYGYSELGTEAATKTMSREDMLAFWRANFVPNNAALVVAGAISAAELKALAEENFGQWQPGQPRTVALGTPATTRAQAVMVDMPGAAQTMLRIGNVAVPRSTPDYAALEVMNTALGGLFSSRINMNLREEHGYTYGAGSVFRYRRSNGPFIIYTSVRTDVTGAAVREIFKEVDRMVAVPLTADELALSKDSLVRSLPGQFETSSQALGSFADTFVYDLGLDYFARLPQRINAVDAAAVQDVAKRHLVPGRMVTVAVGDRARIEAQLREEAGLKNIERRDADGRPL
jgi:zinc protease